MAEFNKAYVVSKSGQIKDKEGNTHIDAIILEGYAGKNWLEIADPYRTDDIKITTLVPTGPLDKNKLIDACMCYLPSVFSGNKMYAAMMEKIDSGTFIDFDSHTNVPKEWSAVREEVRPLFDALLIYEALIK